MQNASGIKKKEYLKYQKASYKHKIRVVCYNITNCSFNIFIYQK